MLRLGRESHVPESSSLQGFLACGAHSQPAAIALMAFSLCLILICALRSRHRLLARSEPFCSCTANCSQPPIPRASGLYRAPSAPGDRNCEAVPLGGPAVPLSPGVSLSMSTGWETGLSPSPSVRTPVKKKPLSDGVTDHSGTPDLVASADGQLHLPGGRVGAHSTISLHMYT